MTFSYFDSWPHYFGTPGNLSETEKDGVTYKAEVFPDDCYDGDYLIETTEQRRQEWANDEWCFTLLRVTACFRGIELASGSIAGVESDSDEGYFRELAEGLAESLQKDVTRELQELLGCVKRACESREVNNG